MGMYRKCLDFALVYLVFTGVAYCSPDQTMTISPSASAGATITASDENTRNSAISTPYNAHTHTDISQTANTLNVGDGAAGNKTICGNAADTTDSCIRWDDTADLWVVDHPTKGSYNQIATTTGTAGLESDQVVVSGGTGALRATTGGSSTQVLVHQGSGTIPAWSALAASTGTTCSAGTTSGTFCWDTDDERLNIQGQNGMNPTGAFKVVTDSRTASSGTGPQTITGCGFRPVAIIIHADSSTADIMSLGMGTQVGNKAVSQARLGSSGGDFARDTTQIMGLSDGTNKMEAVLDKVNSDGIDITWTKTLSPGDVTFELLCMR